MSLFTVLQGSAQSLVAHRGRAHTASHNLANVSTAGYSTQRAELEAILGRPVGSVLLGSGVRLSSITRMRDQFLEAQVTSTYGNAARSQATHQVLSSVRVFDTDVPDRVDVTIAAFFASLSDVALDPSDPGARQAALATADRMTSSFHRAASELASTRQNLDVTVGTAAESADQLATELASLNQAISLERAQGREPADLLDRRTLTAEALSSITGATQIRDDDGNLNLYLGGQVPLVIGHRAASLSAAPDAANGGLLSIQIASADGGPPQTITPPILGGQLGGAIEARDGALLDAANELDQLAFDLAQELNAVHSGGFGLDGATGRNLIDVGAGPAGAASRMALDAAVDGNPDALAAAQTAAGTPGDGGQMLLLIDVERTALSGGDSAVSTAVSLMTDLGAEVSMAAARADQEGALQAHLDEMRQSVSGVSIEEEMVRLTEAQRAFEAVSRVLTTADSMLETVIGLK